MANKVLWSALGTFTVAIAGAGVAPSLKNLADTQGSLGNVIDNTAARDQYALWQLNCKMNSAPSASPYFELYFIQSADGSVYEDATAGAGPFPARPADAIFPIRLVATSQVIILPAIPLPPGKFKPLLINRTGQAVTNADNENILQYRPVNDELQ